MTTPRRLLEIPLYPFLLGLLPLLQFHEKNFRLLRPGDGWRLVLLYWLLTVVLLVAARLLWRSWGRGALVLAPLLTVLFLGKAVGPAPGLLLLTATVVLGVLLRRRPWPVDIPTVLLNVVLAIMVVLPAIARWQGDRACRPPQPRPLFHAPLAVPAPLPGQVPPDIYFLLVDGLGQPGFLETVYDLPAAELTTELEALGLRVTGATRANYPQTALSMAATFNLAPLPDLLTIPDPTDQDRRPLADLIAGNRVQRTLQRLGYRTVAYPSGYPLTRLPRADVQREPLLNPSFVEYHLLARGVLPLLSRWTGGGPADAAFALRRGRLEYIFDHLADARQGARPDQPVFVFAHVLAPHPPFVFDRVGGALPSRRDFAYFDGNHWAELHRGDDRAYHELYRDQAVYVVHRLAQAVAAILERSPRPPVIVIQGDHGPGALLHWNDPEATSHSERLGIFSAWLLPDGAAQRLPDDITAMNTWPAVFNAVFDARLPARPDRFWFARMREPYRYIEVVQ